MTKEQFVEAFEMEMRERLREYLVTLTEEQLYLHLYCASLQIEIGKELLS